MQAASLFGVRVRQLNCTSFPFALFPLLAFIFILEL